MGAACGRRVLGRIPRGTRRARVVPPTFELPFALARVGLPCTRHRTGGEPPSAKGMEAGKWNRPDPRCGRHRQHRLRRGHRNPCREPGRRRAEQQRDLRERIRHLHQRHVQREHRCRGGQRVDRGPEWSGAAVPPQPTEQGIQPVGECTRRNPAVAVDHALHLLHRRRRSATQTRDLRATESGAPEDAALRLGPRDR